MTRSREHATGISLPKTLEWKRVNMKGPRPLPPVEQSWHGPWRYTLPHLVCDPTAPRPGTPTRGHCPLRVSDCIYCASGAQLRFGPDILWLRIHSEHTSGRGRLQGSRWGVCLDSDRIQTITVARASPARGTRRRSHCIQGSDCDRAAVMDASRARPVSRRPVRLDLWRGQGYAGVVSR
jgi:hypothetical protein